MAHFNDKMKQLVEKSQWKLKRQLLPLEDSERAVPTLDCWPEKWFRMTEARQARHLQKFNSVAITSTSPGHPLTFLAKEVQAKGDILLQAMMITVTSHLDVTYERQAFPCFTR